MKSRLSTFKNELVTRSFTASNIPGSNLSASDFPASNFPIDLVIVVWSILDYFVSNWTLLTALPCRLPMLKVNAWLGISAPLSKLTWIIAWLGRWHKHFYLQANKLLFAAVGCSDMRIRFNSKNIQILVSSCGAMKE